MNPSTIRAKALGIADVLTIGLRRANSAGRRVASAVIEHSEQVHWCWMFELPAQIARSLEKRI